MVQNLTKFFYFLKLASQTPHHQIMRFYFTSQHNKKKFEHGGKHSGGPTRYRYILSISILQLQLIINFFSQKLDIGF